MQEYGYALMPPIEKMLASYLSVGEASASKTTSLPTKPLRVTSHLNGMTYVEVG